MEWIGAVNGLFVLCGFIVSIIGWFIKIEINNNTNSKRIDKLESCKDDNDLEFRNMRESIVRLETMMNSIIESIGKIQTSIEAINNKLYDRRPK